MKLTLSEILDSPSTDTDEPVPQQPYIELVGRRFIINAHIPIMESSDETERYGE